MSEADKQALQTSISEKVTALANGFAVDGSLDKMPLFSLYTCLRLTPLSGAMYDFFNTVPWGGSATVAETVAAVTPATADVTQALADQVTSTTCSA